jgi:hypothetical protein
MLMRKLLKPSYGLPTAAVLIVCGGFMFLASSGGFHWAGAAFFVSGVLNVIGWAWWPGRARSGPER